ncbi:MAG: hypothetical protein NC240_10150 [Clostridium sp.]|nr:hypothetical protein [Clostridium sp.]
MQKIIFTKYSNDRNPDYNIKTSIMEDGKGNRYVYKTGVSDGGKKHIRNMYENSRKLQEVFSDSIFEINKSEMKDDNLLLEYVYGETLEETLDRYLASKNYDAFTALIKKYAYEMRKNAVNKFVPCEEYYKVFGKTAVDTANCGAMLPCDIDLIFPNIIDADGKWTILDYEWVFNFAIPVDFVLFRAIYYYDFPCRAKLLDGINLCKLLEIDEKLYDVYKAMDDEFQNYVFNGNIPLWELYGKFGKKVHFAGGLPMENVKYKIECIRFYADHYVSEYIDIFPDENGKVAVYIDVDESVQTLAVDPASCSCIVHVDKALGIADDEYELLYGNNGESTDNKTIYFNHGDPRFLFDDFHSGIKQIYFEFHINYIDNESSNHICKMIGDFNDIRYSNLTKDSLIAEQSENMKTLRQELTEQSENVKALQQELENIKNSTSWKITEPMRNITKKIRR